jgi:hypothetical protein
MEEWGSKLGEYIGEFIENITFLIIGIQKAQDFDDIFRTVVAVTRFFTKKGFGSTLMDIMDHLTTESEAQSFDFNDIRSMLDNYSAVRTSPIVIKVHRLCSMALSSCILEACGITAKLTNISAVYGEATKQFLAETDFVTGLIDLVSFMVERLAQCWHLKSFSPLFHSSKSYGKWAVKAAELIEQSQLLHNPEANGFTFHGFLEDLETAIEEGVQIRKFSQSADKKDVVINVLSKLRIIRGDVLTRKTAGEERRAPFSLLVYGGSGVAKSSFVRTFFGHFGKMFHLPVGSDFVFTRSFADEYWSNFRTQMWGIILDDIAAINPNKGNEDRSLNEILQIINNVPYCPPQAELENKGRTPLRAECVIGTTNTKHLNAHNWFSNPVAVRRRFPYVVDLKPKKCYARDDAPDMIDPAKIPIPDAGSYPDLWTISLSKVVVVTTDDDGKQDVKLIHLDTYTNVYKFFATMSVIIREFRAQQSQAAANDANLTTVKLCPFCDVPRNHCDCIMLQAQDVVVSPVWESEPVNWTDTARGIANLAAVAGIAAATFTVLDDDAKVARDAYAAVKNYSKDFLVGYMTNLGKSLVKEVFGNRTVQMVLTALGLLSSGFAAYKLYKKFTEPVAQAEELPIAQFGVRPCSTGDEKENFYHQKNDYRANMVVTDQTRSWKGLEWTAICAKFQNSVVAIRTVRKNEAGLTVCRDGRAVCVGGRLYVTDNHNLPETVCSLEVVRELHTSGLTTNVTRVLDPDSVLRMPESELVFFQLLDAFDCKDISPFLSTSEFTTTCSGALISRHMDGSPLVSQISRLTDVGVQPVPQVGGQHLRLWEYNLDTETAVGLCGSLVVARSPTGPVIVGLHLLGRGRNGHCVSLTTDHVRRAKEHFFPVFSPAPIMLESIERSVGVVPLHDKSVFRFIGSGVGRVFGQLTLPRAQPKSTVCPTIFREAAVKRGFEVTTGAPVMKGKKLWRQAVLPIVEQKFLFKESVVRKCAMQYADEVFAGLSESDKREIAQPLDMMTAINGIPGRKYIDSMNRGTSAGFPWMCTKKKVCFSVPADDTWQDPIDVNDEVKARANEMYERYLRHELAAPLFTAHAKDEALPFAKIESEKTRIMNGGPFDWSILVRMVYLPLVRVIQNNKFLFESMPGAVAQSVEWDDIYKFITAFGEDKMIAGDYGKFDKRMSAVFILWGFFTLITIAKRCGASMDHLTVMWGIAYDIACSFCNFNGDLVQFLGSNPSGHPLTVIINCIVNCLYMRYCYHELNPEKEVASFREFVRLITYGDDNEMGSDRPWFNHTAISEMLATLGVEYTMADKTAESVPFLNVKDTSFLKRGWRYEPELDAVVCPIVHATLDKMMTTWVPSSTIGPFAQGEEIIRNVGVEYFWYGREIFEEKQKVLKEIFKETIPDEYETVATFPTWEALIIRWKMSSGLLVPPVGAEAE